MIHFKNARKYEKDNDKLLDILTDNGINLQCDENMNIVISDEDARKVEDIVEKDAPAAEFDYTLEEY